MSDVAAGSVPSVERVAAIIAIDDRVIRNLEITECYADLSMAFRDRSGDAANWCTFAMWASRQAGSTIRGEDFVDRLERRLGDRAWLAAPLQSFNRFLLRKGLFEPNTRLGRAIAEIHTPIDAFERASEAVAAGNLKVFEEIAREFALLMATVPADALPESPEFAAFAARFRPGPPPDGQDYLREAFAHYQQHHQETDRGVRAAWILLANLKIGLHEQTRLQPEIVAAVEAPFITVTDLGSRVLHALFPSARRWPRVVHGPITAVLGRLAITIRSTAVRVSREIVTEAMMVIAIPGMVLSLGRNLDVPVPAVLVGVAHSGLDAFVKQHDPCAPGTSICGADDWSDLEQRMHYILHFFRAFADESSLFARPFTPSQVAQFRAGIVPEGEL